MSLDVEGIVHGVATKLWKQYPQTELDDLVAQGYLIVTEKIELYNKRKGTSLETYLYNTVQYGLSDYIRRYVIKEDTLGGLRMDCEEDPAGRGICRQVEARIDLEGILESLEGDALTATIMLAEGYTLQEIGNHLGISKQRVSQILTKVRGDHESKVSEV